MDEPKSLSTRPGWTEPCDRWPLRLLLAVCQGVAIGLTWSLWQVRTGRPPNLPLIDAGWVDALQFGFGWPLLATLVLAVCWPAVGVVVHLAVLALAMACDQMRIQPEFISVAILLAGTLPRRGPLLVARSHLVSLWTFSGLHKLLSPEYWHETGPMLARMLFPWLGDDQALIGGIAIAIGELLTGLAVLLPFTRRAVPWMAVALHGGILLSLVLDWWNSAVWPWNIALAAAGWGLIAGWRGSLLSYGSDLPQPIVPVAAGARPTGGTSLAQRRLWQCAAIFALLHPLLFYIDAGDAYASWCVYANNGPDGTFYAARDEHALEILDQDPTAWPYEPGEELLLREYDLLNVPFPPATRLFRQYLRRLGQPGDMVIVVDPRLWPRWRGYDRLMYLKERDGTVSATPIKRQR
ncbi:MAG: hypothetical protein SFU86_05380 [Pirellulaceae bacterium]|nr:hypothetical protein [Pirellulaceae bacterium]